MLDPPEHGKWRHLLASYSRPARSNGWPTEQRLFARELVDEIAGAGRCDYVADFAHRFPTTIFLRILGAPVDMLPTFLEWEAGIFQRDEDASPDGAITTMMQVMEYFGGLIAECRGAGDDAPPTSSAPRSVGRSTANPSRTTTCCRACCCSSWPGSTRTWRSSPTACTTSPRHRPTVSVWSPIRRSSPSRSRRCCAPSRSCRPPARSPPTSSSTAAPASRRHGGVPPGSANRDEQTFPDGTEFALDRGFTRHIAVGAGPHRCLGSHLARQEMAIAIEEWHRRIPAYRLDPGREASEHGGPCTASTVCRSSGTRRAPVDRLPQLPPPRHRQRWGVRGARRRDRHHLPKLGGAQLRHRRDRPPRRVHLRGAAAGRAAAHLPGLPRRIDLGSPAGLRPGDDRAW